MEIDRKNFYVTLLSNASQKIYPDNTKAAFIIHLQQPINLGTSSDWEVGVCEVSYKPPKRHILNGVIIDFIGETNALIYCDLIAPQFVGKYCVRFLRTIIYPFKLGEHHFQYIFYFPVEKREFQDIHIEIKKLDGESAEFEESTVPVKIVLHFRRMQKLYKYP